MREEFKDILDHTYATGFITELKITGDKESTLIETIDENNRVVIKGYLKTPLANLHGEFGVGRLGILKSIVEYPNLKSPNATSEIIHRKRGEDTVPDEIVFKNENGTPWNHRFMSADLVRDQVDFRGVDWTVEFTPTKSEIQDFTYITNAYAADETLFTVKEEGGELRFYVGENGGTYVTINTPGKVKFKSAHKWPFVEVIKVLKLDEGNALVSIYDAPKMGALQITVDTKFAKWLYIFPAATE
ncbi:MAG: hypothetical protein HC836_22825 [Richelia sp. RM2_1_2]|nr:hypothetical protein [Richelia sp. RM2_1_2]